MAAQHSKGENHQNHNHFTHNLHSLRPSLSPSIHSLFPPISPSLSPFLSHSIPSPSLSPLRFPFLSPSILVPRGRAPFGQHQEIATSGSVQRHSGFEWLSKHNRLRTEPIRFVKLDCEHAQSDGKSVNRGLPVLEPARGRDFLVLTKRSAASGDENARLLPSLLNPVLLPF